MEMFELFNCNIEIGMWCYSLSHTHKEFIVTEEDFQN